MGLRTRLFGVSLLILGVFLVTSGPWLHRKLEQQLIVRIEGDLRDHAQLVAVTLEAAHLGAPPLDLAGWAWSIGQHTDTRITIIAGDGMVLGDSKVPPTELGRLDDHSTRPEVLAALATGHGVSRRHSASLGIDLLYVALPAAMPGQPQTVVRAALPLAEVDQARRALWALLVLAGGLGVVASAGLSVLASRWLTRDLLRLLDTIRQLTAPAPDGRVPPDGASFHRLADELDARMRELAAERDTVATVLTSMAEGVLALDADGRIALCNPSARERLGLPAEPEGTPLPRDPRLVPIHDLIGSSARSGAPAMVELTWDESSLASGQVRPPRILAVTATPRTGGGCVLVLLDQTRVRRLETLRQDFVANVSHELRTPLSVIRANVEALQDGALEDAATTERFLGHIQRTTERLGNLVVDLLSLSRIEAGAGRYTPQALDVLATAPHWAEGVEVQLAERDQRLETHVAPGLHVWADPSALEQVLVNLLDNASKYAPQGSTVALHAREREGVVRLEVRDEGPGVPVALRPRLFERFFRVDPGRSRGMGGTGLGLAIVKHLVEAMDGRVGMTGRKPTGSVFWVELPRPPK